jgi:hypothetical protein
MLTALTTGLRFRLGITFLAFAALCFLAPPAVLAFGHGAATADCMAHADMVGHGKMATPHKSEHHGDHSNPTSKHQPSCCGLFCMSALAANNGEAIAPPFVYSAQCPAREPSLFSHVTERLDRPPISQPIV